MKMFSVAVMSAAVLTGLAGAGVAYEIASAGDSTTATSVTPTTPKDAAKPRKRWAPCEPPAVRDGKACVTDVVRTVVLPAAGAQVGVAFARRSDDGLDSHDAVDDHGDHGPLHDAFDDHGDDFDDDHDAFDDHGGDRDDDFDDDHSGSDDDDDHDDHDDHDHDDDHDDHDDGDDFDD